MSGLFRFVFIGELLPHPTSRTLPFLLTDFKKPVFPYGFKIVATTSLNPDTRNILTPYFIVCHTLCIAGGKAHLKRNLLFKKCPIYYYLQRSQMIICSVRALLFTVFRIPLINTEICVMHSNAFLHLYTIVPSPQYSFPGLALQSSLFWII